MVLAGIPACCRECASDFDPITCRTQDSEAVSTYRELINVPELGISSVNIVAPSVAEIDRNHPTCRRPPRGFGNAVDREPGPQRPGPESFR